MKKFFLFAVAAAMVSFSSCNKDPQDVYIKSQNTAVVELGEVLGSWTTEFSMDDDEYATYSLNVTINGDGTCSYTYTKKDLDAADYNGDSSYTTTALYAYYTFDYDNTYDTVDIFAESVTTKYVASQGTDSNNNPIYTTVASNVESYIGITKMGDYLVFKIGGTNYYCKRS